MKTLLRLGLTVLLTYALLAMTQCESPDKTSVDTTQNVQIR